MGSVADAVITTDMRSGTDAGLDTGGLPIQNGERRSSHPYNDVLCARSADWWIAYQVLTHERDLSFHSRC
jgi:hypothetical protein